MPVVSVDAGRSSVRGGGAHRSRAGIARRNLAERFGDLRVIHARYMRRSRSGVWSRLSTHSDDELAMLDVTIITARQAGSGEKG